MKRVALACCLAGVLPASAVAAFGLPWFHTRPKPVLFEEPPVMKTRVPMRKPVAHPGSGPSDLKPDDHQPRLTPRPYPAGEPQAPRLRRETAR